MKRYKQVFENKNLKESSIPSKFKDKINVDIHSLDDLKKVIIRIVGTYFNDIKPVNYVVIEHESYDFDKTLFSGSTLYKLNFIIKDTDYQGNFNIYTPTGFLNKHLEKRYWIFITNKNMELNIEINNKSDYK